MEDKIMSKKYYIIMLLSMMIFFTYTFSQNQNPGQSKGKVYKWKMVTAWPKNFPIFQTSAEKFADDVRIITKGQFDIQVIAFEEADNESITNLEDVFTAVSRGFVEMGHTSPSYWVSKLPGCEFFSTIPFGLDVEGMHAWLYRGGGIELWRALYAPYNLIPFPVGNTGPAMGGWFNKKIEKLSDLEGLKIRIAGLGGKVYRKAGAKTVLLPASQILTAFEEKKIDAAVFEGPYLDRWLRLYRAAKYYYYPGWHDPCKVLELIINRNAWDSLPQNLQETIKLVASKSYKDTYTQFDILNSIAFREMQQQEDIEFVEFPITILTTFRQLTMEVLEDEANNNYKFKKIYEAYKDFVYSNNKWRSYSGISLKNSSIGTITSEFIEEFGISKNSTVHKEGNNTVVISLKPDSSFDKKSSAPLPKLILEIDSITSIIRRNHLLIKAIRVQDYTYDNGTKWKNLKLSLKRAEAIKKLLIDKGVKPSIKVVPLGDSAGYKNIKNKIEIIIEF